MVLTLETENQLVYSYLEWDVVNSKGQRMPFDNYLYIRNFWVSPQCRNSTEKIIKLFIKMLEKDETTVNVKGIYWQRTMKKSTDKSFQRVSKTFSRETCLRRINKFFKED